MIIDREGGDLMKITSEEVKELQRRIDVTYEEAEKLLIRCGGNLNKAVKMHEQKKDALPNKFFEEAKRIFNELLTYNIKITRHDEVLMNLPLIIIIGFFLIMNVDLKVWIAVISIGIILISESTVSIYKKEKKDTSIIIKSEPEARPETSDNVVKTETTVDVPVKNDLDTEVSHIVTDGQVTLDNKQDEEDDDYYEITIEK